MIFIDIYMIFIIKTIVCLILYKLYKKTLILTQQTTTIHTK